MRVKAAAAPESAGFGDPLQYEFPLPLQAVFHPMGRAVRISTNSQAVLDAARYVWGLCTPHSTGAAIEVRFAVKGVTSTRPVPPPFPFGQEHLISVVHSRDNFAVADVDRGFIFGWVTADTVEDGGYFRYHFLEALVYLTLTCLHFVPVHAGCAALGGRGVLLCGDSGCGKTSLAYALARRGWTYVSDDAAYVVRSEAWRAAGRPHHIRFRSSAVQLFPELARLPMVLRPTGKLDLEIPTSQLGFASIAESITPWLLLFLRRESGTTAPRVAPMSREAAQAKLEQVVCYGPRNVRVRQRDTIAELVKLPVFTLSYSDFEDTETFLRDFVAAG
jgi:hypothetical protein